MRFLTLLAALPLALAAPAPILEVRDGAQRIPGRFIVVMKQNADDTVFQKTLDRITGVLGRAPRDTFKLGAFKAFSLSSSDSLIQTIANLGNIDFIEPDFVVRTTAITSQNNAPWGLARISSPNPGTTTYRYDSSAGDGTVAYGIDTGVFCGHSDFGGRCTFGANFADSNNNDGNGHGTHTAATIAGTTYGVAKKTQVIAVKVLGDDGSGANSNVLKGIEWAANDMVRRGKVGKAVANLSLGGPRLGEASNRAVAAAVAKGLFMAVAAGNNGGPVALTSPASEATACTVGASDKNDNFASFSNYGRGVDIIAPGVNITSAWIRSATDTNTISGTSMATPHVAGLGAYLLALEGSKSPAALCSRISQLSTKNKVKFSGGLFGGLFGAGSTPNQLAFNGVN